MATTMIQSYFRINGDFVPIEDFTGTLSDKLYIEGAIVCRINGRELFQLKHHDLIDQLWVYIVEGLNELREGKDYDAFFPDQPLRLRFAVISPRCVEVTIGNESNRVDYDEFRSALKRGALRFFARVKELVPEASGVWDRYREEAEMIRG